MLPVSLKLALHAAQGAVLTAPLACSSPTQGMTPSRPVANAARDDEALHGSSAGFDAEHLESLMRSMIGELQTAQTPDELDWALSDLIVGGALEDFLAAAFAVLPRVPAEELDVATEELDRELRDAVHRALLSAEVSLRLLQRAAETDSRPEGPASRDPASRESSGLADLWSGEGEPPSFQEILYGDELPPAVQQALYAGHVAFLALLTLLDEGPMPPWLHAELRQRLVASQHEYLALVVAYARREGIALPEPLGSVEALDIDEAEREGQCERSAVDFYLDGLRAARNKS